MSTVPSNKPSILLIGGGAAGLWTGLALLDQGWSGTELAIVEPSGKTENDRTWSYRAKRSLLPGSVKQRAFSKLVVANNGERNTYSLGHYQYYSLRSGDFYAYAKQVLAKAGVQWLHEKATSLLEQNDQVEVRLSNGGSLTADYVLDSRPPKIELPSSRYNATLQHFGGWFVEMKEKVFDPEQVVFMDFVNIEMGVAFFYVIPTSPKEALVEIAVFSEGVWETQQYDTAIKSYIIDKYESAPATIKEREYGVIPMTDEPLWNKSSALVWNIGTRGGWVQPSSGYAFTRTARFAGEVASALNSPHPKPWRPSSIHQVFNSVMLGYIIDNPSEAGKIFFDLFAKNGPERTFDFLDEAASFSQTVRLMWTCPQLPFAKRAIKEIILRIGGSK